MGMSYLLERRCTIIPSIVFQSIPVVPELSILLALVPSSFVCISNICFVTIFYLVGNVDVNWFAVDEVVAAVDGVVVIVAVVVVATYFTLTCSNKVFEESKNSI